MRQLKTAAIIAIAVILQASLRNIWPPFRFLDCPLIVVVYFALVKDPLEALLVAAVCGIATDAVGAGGLMGSSGFSKTVTAFVIVTLFSRLLVNNPLARIPVMAGAIILDSAVYVLLNKAFGNPTFMPFVSYVAYKLIATTAVGAIILFTTDVFFSERARQRRKHAFRRRIARRNISTIGRRR
jgi:rod shape-determining protein MreD